MAYDLIPNRFLSFPGNSLSSIFDDDEFFNSPVSQNGLSISEDEKKVYVEAAIPGVNPDNVEVTFHDGYLWIRGEQKKEEKDKKRKFYRQAATSFSYRVAVPGEIDQNTEPEAHYKHGVMKVQFAKSPKVEPKKIKVNVEKQDK